MLMVSIGKFLSMDVTRVGQGPLNNELTSEQAGSRGWQEFGSVTGRQRRAVPYLI